MRSLYVITDSDILVPHPFPPDIVFWRGLDTMVLGTVPRELHGFLHDEHAVRACLRMATPAPPPFSLCDRPFEVVIFDIRNEDAWHVSRAGVARFRMPLPHVPVVAAPPRDVSPEKWLERACGAAPRRYRLPFVLQSVGKPEVCDDNP